MEEWINLDVSQLLIFIETESIYAAMPDTASVIRELIGVELMADFL